MDCLATTPGLFPLPDDAKQRLADLKGHQKHDLISGEESDALTAVYDEVRTDLVDVQTEAGLDLVGEGQARWDDMLAHPLAVHDNVETRGIVRYYDNNNFYREPVVTGDLTFDGDVAAELEAAAEHTDALQAVLPGPYSLAHLATNEHYDGEVDFLTAIADFLAGEAAAFPDAVESLFLLEPSLVTAPPTDDVADTLAEAIDTVTAAIDAPAVTHTYFGALDEKTHAHVLDADVSAVGYDFVTAPEASLELVNEYGTKDDVALGLVDGQNTLVEDPTTVRERVDWVADNAAVAEFDTAYVTTNTELFYLPVNRFEEKLETLADAVSLTEATA
jgi:5-methyltetrahydropteroyltriglutamate--homocysteine methyltransferase